MENKEKSQNIGITVGAFIINQQNKLLLTKSHKWSNKYVVPAGHIEYGEKAEEALIREAKEETGLDILNIKFLSFDDLIEDKIFYKKRHSIVLNFLCRTKSSKVILNDEAQGYEWVNPEDALKKDLAPFAQNVINKFLKEMIYN